MITPKTFSGTAGDRAMFWISIGCVALMTLAAVGLGLTGNAAIGVMLFFITVTPLIGSMATFAAISKR